MENFKKTSGTDVLFDFCKEHGIIGFSVQQSAENKMSCFHNVERDLLFEANDQTEMLKSF